MTYMTCVVSLIGWLGFIFFIECWFLSISSFNIELNENQAYEFIFLKIIPVDFACQSELTN